MPNLYVRLTNDELDILQSCVGMGAATAHMLGNLYAFPFLGDLAKELSGVVRDDIAGDTGPRVDTVLSNYPVVQQVSYKTAVKQEQKE